MKKGIIFGIGIGILIFGIIVGLEARSTPLGIPELGGIPDSKNNEMPMSDKIKVTVSRGDATTGGSTDEDSNEKTIQVNIDDGVGSGD